MASKIRYNDEVIILTGKNKGEKGIVKKVISSEKVIIEGLNLIKKHQKSVPDKNQQGGIIMKEAPIHISNVAIYNSKTKKADRIGFRFIKGKKVRFFKSTNIDIK